MGALDDAIREHLELKRRQGASEEELKRKEDEAFGHPSFGSTVTPQVATPEAAAPEAQVPETAPEAEPGVSEPFEPALDAANSPEPPLAAPEDVELTDERSLAETEIEPDEVLPEDALEPERKNGALGDDKLEEPPDFLEETPGFLDEEPSDQERLWFERKPPKDFDFDS
jgi:hypothetical protein